jgi:hypothetical protein
MVLLIMLSSLCLSANGQRTAELGKFNVGIETNLGITTAKSVFGYGLGVKFNLDLVLSEELTLGGAVGYSRLLTKDTSPVKDYDFIPLIALIKVFPTPTSFYALGLTGIGLGIQSGSKPSYIFGGGFGYQWNNIYDVAMKFEGYRQSKNSSTYQPFNGLYAIGFAYMF